MLVKNFQVTSAGGTETVDVNDFFTDYLVTGTATLSSSYTIAPSGTPTRPFSTRIIFNTRLDLDGNDVVVFGKKLSSSQVLSGGIINIAYDALTPEWVVNVVPIPASRATSGVDTSTYTTGDLILNLNALTNKQVLLIDGSATMSGDIGIDGVQFTPTTNLDGDMFIVLYKATLSPATHSVTIFGASLTDDEIAIGDIMILAIWDGTSSTWLTQKITSKAFGLNEIVTATVGFDTDEQGTVPIVIPYNFRLIGYGYAVTQTMAGTDDATLAVDINGTLVTPPNLTIPMTSAVGFGNVAPVTAGNVGVAGDLINVTMSKTTPGGRVLFQMTLVRRPS